jgi:pyrroline-5-carboxylate reductase
MTGHARITFIGGGNMARSLIGARLRDGATPDSMRVAEPDADARARLVADFGVAVFERGAPAVADAELIVLAVKPQVLREVCIDLAGALGPRRPLIVSIAAGIRSAAIDGWLGGGFPIVRCMPNTPALIGAGATALHANAQVDAPARARAEGLLASAGSTAWIDDETLMDVVTALSGSGPAYFFLLIEALEDAAVAEGLARDTARALAVQTALGAARMASEDGESPARLRERVTSPGGTTQAALDAFADGGLRALVASAVTAATARGRELSERFGSDTP